MPPEEQAQTVARIAIDLALQTSMAAATDAAAEDDWVLVDATMAAAPEAEDAAVRLQASHRGRRARQQVDRTKSYIECLQAGQAANKAGEYRRAREVRAVGTTARASSKKLKKSSATASHRLTRTCHVWQLFLAAHEMTGRAEPRISATNMRLKLFEVRSPAICRDLPRSPAICP